MSKPKRGPQRDGTYFVTAQTFQRRALFRSERIARLFFDYRAQLKYLLHEFVLMPNHFHLIITPLQTLERSVQFVRGGFSRRAGLELGSAMEIWQRGFSDHRIRDLQDYRQHREYIRMNPVRAHLAQLPEQYLYSSAFPGYSLDPLPQRLKPDADAGLDRHG